jgi:hypothetical protein
LVPPCQPQRARGERLRRWRAGWAKRPSGLGGCGGLLGWEADGLLERCRVRGLEFRGIGI